MPFISDRFHKKKLHELGINIKSKYIVGNKILERNTDNSVNDDITSGILSEKEYYKDKVLVHTEKVFDSRIEYSFISKDMENKDYTCPNCGMESKLKDFIDGCPYCKSFYNIDYTDKDLGSKYHYDRVLKNNTYRFVTAIIDIVISIILCFLFIKITSRTFNQIDIIKIFVYGIILSMVLYYFFYLLDAYIILGPIKRYKDKQNQKQMEFWQKTNIDKKTFYNNLNYEIRKYYYSKEDIIDFDILDYNEFESYKKNDTDYIKVLIEVRIIRYVQGEIHSKIEKEEFILKKNPNERVELKEGANQMKCHNCGASINITDEECSYCHTETKYLQEWILEK